MIEKLTDDSDVLIRTHFEQLRHNFIEGYRLWRKAATRVDPKFKEVRYTWEYYCAMRDAYVDFSFSDPNLNHA